MLKIVLAGIGGMGWVYLEELVKGLSRREYRLEGVVDPVPERCPDLSVLHELRTPVYADLAAFYDRHRADLAVISSPIQHHAAQTICALKNGSDVLVEKPAAAAIQDVSAMEEAERQTRLPAAVGYQWSFSQAVQALKTDILDGRFGAPLRMRCLYLWPRDFAYYRRNDWAGRRSTAGGAWVLDGPANNAMAHDLHNIFYLLGPEVAESTRPLRVQAELYRAYAIENYDTAAARFDLPGGVETLIWFSHASLSDPGPLLSLEFEKGRIEKSGRATPFTARFDDGSEKSYGDPDAEPLRKLRLAIAGRRSGSKPLCGIAASSSQTLAVNGMQDSCPSIPAFPEDLIREIANGAERRLAVKGLDEDFRACYEAGRLPSEMGISWAAAGEPIDLTAYGRFPAK